MCAIIEFHEITKIYDKDLGRKSIAIRNLTLSVLNGEVFGVVGPNGAGKTTSLRILMGLAHATSGSVNILNSPLQDSEVYSAIGYLPENACLYDNLSVVDHLEFAGKIAGYPRNARRDRTEELLMLVNLQDAAKIPIRKFSKGMKQRAALAYALFNNPKILVLDEPMSGLDPVGRKLVVDIIKNYNKLGNTILFCSHILTDVRKVCDRIGIMNRGQLQRILQSNELLNDNDLETIFLQTVSTPQ